MMSKNDYVWQTEKGGRQSHSLLHCTSQKQYKANLDSKNCLMGRELSNHIIRKSSITKYKLPRKHYFQCSYKTLNNFQSPISTQNF